MPSVTTFIVITPSAWLVF